MTQKESILSFLNSQSGNIILKEVYNAFPDYPKPSVRRVMQELTNLSNIGRESRGIYITPKTWDISERQRLEYEEMEEYKKYIGEDKMYRITVSLRIPYKDEYFNQTVHYYGYNEDDALNQVTKMMEMCITALEEALGYNQDMFWFDSEPEDFNISEIEEMDRDDKLIGEFEVEDLWEL